MNCCVECFVSPEIKSIISSLDNNGNCAFCDSRNVQVYDLKADDGLDNLFNEILNIFKLGSELITDGFPEVNLISIRDQFENKWKIFNGFAGDKIYTFLKTLLERKYPDKMELLINQVGIIEWMNKEYLEEKSVLKGHTWTDFVNYIKYRNRFHSKYVNFGVLNEYIEKLTTFVEEDIFYRGRISNDKELGIKNMGAPDPPKSSAGRANSEGISHLYLASAIETVVSEIRPSISDTVYIGKFPLKQKLKVIDFRMLKNLDVFTFEDPVMYAINLDIFNEMSMEISKPVRSGDSKLEYLPTQFIVDYIKSLNEIQSESYQGIVFESTLSTKGYNLMVFDTGLLECTTVEKIIINNISYNY
ncbi:MULTISPECIES: RES family NAD+ phosphorylase [unclassified Bacillus (in: firmicutes)]|uniref:RES family NAD+ phosphorylase n=1 Tax=unclassified Bacillus (in: firmicutes) TaxID=185979 RepID=UPI0011E6C9B4|nr:MULTISPECIES: RES family NAD+ phosphorylase [unclassified Bacillus (in: firmicutes)]MCA0120160.1 RES family NAD+ phosphorylase [Bacillus sp. RSS_NA_20]TYO53718.1 RES family NAD+ phosphorylase [Bacillus sp. Y3]